MATTMNISLPDTMKTFVENTIAAEGYGTASEYIRELIRADQRRKEQERLERTLLKAIEGEPSELNDEVWEGIRKRVGANLNRSSKGKK